MSRSANCIKMLLLLKARGFMTREELAEMLETNVRNIGEYRKELEEAGYQIDSTTGKYGGYQIKSGTLFPVVGLRLEEFQSIIEAKNYMQSHGDFLQFNDFQKAIDKLLSTSSLQKQASGVYVEHSQGMSGKLRNFIQEVDSARKNREALDIEYKGMYATDYQKVRIHPYEILNDKGSYYCLGYSLKAKAFRNFKFSEERMANIQHTGLHFQRDLTFQVRDHIGQMGLIHDRLYNLELLLQNETALLLSEKPVGIDPQWKWINDATLHYTALMEGELPTIKFLLSLGNQVTLLQPFDLKKKMGEIVEEMHSQYNSVK